jgi:hypothetical protein
LKLDTVRAVSDDSSLEEITERAEFMAVVQKVLDPLDIMAMPFSRRVKKDHPAGQSQACRFLGYELVSETNWLGEFQRRSSILSIAMTIFVIISTQSSFWSKSFIRRSIRTRELNTNRCRGLRYVNHGS